MGSGLLHDAGREPVVQWQDAVFIGLDPPQIDQLLQLLRVLFGQVVTLGEIFSDVVELPLVIIEMTSGFHLVFGDRLPALVPQRSGTEDLVILGLLTVRCIGNITLYFIARKRKNGPVSIRGRLACQ